jgi:hypothetical protein
MAIDFDQSGTSRQWERTYLGPSVGWIMAPLQNVQIIATPGTYNIDPSVSLIKVNVAGAVTIILPSAQTPSAGPLAQPQLFAKNPVTIVDIGGNANAHPITIQRNNAAESIMGLASIQMTSNFGGFTLRPVPEQKLWSTS